MLPAGKVDTWSRGPSHVVHVSPPFPSPAPPCPAPPTHEPPPLLHPALPPQIVSPLHTRLRTMNLADTAGEMLSNATGFPYRSRLTGRAMRRKAAYVSPFMWKVSFLSVMCRSGSRLDPSCTSTAAHRAVNGGPKTPSCTQARHWLAEAGIAASCKARHWLAEGGIAASC